VAEIIFPLLGKRPPFAKKSTKATGRDRTVSTKKARTELGWTSAVTYAQSMQRIAAWVRQNGI
jgi:nucleoside-diphosphate-sugar epimerase